MHRLFEPLLPLERNDAQSLRKFQMTTGEKIIAAIRAAK